MTIPLSSLTPWKGNVRKTDSTEGIDELAASLAAHGQLQSLVVREAKGGKYEILAGRRRYLAMRHLAKTGQITKDHPVQCTVAVADVDATELSLAENIFRAPMHPADQFEAFRDLIDAGASVTDVAARFGVADSVVVKRLKLGRLSPLILDAYRKGEIDLDEAQAFALTDDHDAQERALLSLPDWNRTPHSIRRALTQDEVAASDKRVRFLGLDAYEAAGGVLRKDLFADENDVYVVDVELLDRLVAEKLAPISEKILSEGWRWTEIVVDLDHSTLSRLGRRHPQKVALPKAKQAKLDRLMTEYDELVDAESDNASERLGVLEQHIDELTAIGQRWSEETLKIAGAIVSLDCHGRVSVDRGLVREDDLATDSTRDEQRLGGPATKGLSPRLVEDLTAQRTAAIGAELMAQPGIALTAVVHALALRTLYDYSTAESCLKLSSNFFPRHALITPDACIGLNAIQRKCDLLTHRLPGNPDDLWAWCLERSHDELLEVLALVAAKSVNAVQRKGDRPNAPSFDHATLLARALKVDMTVWFSPTADNYFARINRSQILADIDAAKGSHAPSLDKLKKSELAARAEVLVADTGWLPAPLHAAVQAAE